MSCNDVSKILTSSEIYSTEIEHIKQFAKDKNYNQSIAFMIDYSVHSGSQRFFVVDLRSAKIINIRIGLPR